MAEPLLPLRGKCPGCLQSIMNDTVLVDGVASVDLVAKVRHRVGHIHLSQAYGSYNKVFRDVDDIPGSIAQFSCPHCQEPLPVRGRCPDCRAPVVAVDLEIGGFIKFCSRNGCKHHALEFEDINDAFRLYESQHPLA